MQDIKQTEKVLKALANKRRLAILRYLKKEKEATVSEIAAAIKLSFKATSKHLQILSSAEIVEKDQRRLNMFYRPLYSINSVSDHVLNIL